ncbi:MAG: hypothetical protein U5K54_28680 [Cytophagales bacterium]|nr:hypothetical protein [Cytophagales bacterium]
MLKISPQSVEKMMPQDRLYSLRSLDTPMAGKILARWLFGMGIVILIVFVSSLAAEHTRKRKSNRTMPRQQTTNY